MTMLDGSAGLSKRVVGSLWMEKRSDYLDVETENRTPMLAKAHMRTRVDGNVEVAESVHQKSGLVPVDLFGRLRIQHLRRLLTDLDAIETPEVGRVRNLYEGNYPAMDTHLRIFSAPLQSEPVLLQRPINGGVLLKILQSI